jgi:hypothetical protein
MVDPMARDPDPFASAAERTAALRDDPFARAAQAGDAAAADSTDTLHRPLARRDPEAPPETASFVVDEPVTIDDVLRRARWMGFAAGMIVGALLATGVALLVSWWTAAPPGGLPVP